MTTSTRARAAQTHQPTRAQEALFGREAAQIVARQVVAAALHTIKRISEVRDLDDTQRAWHEADNPVDYSLELIRDSLERANYADIDACESTLYKAADVVCQQFNFYSEGANTLYGRYLMGLRDMLLPLGELIETVDFLGHRRATDATASNLK